MSLGIIGGTGALDLFEVLDEQAVDTPFGEPSTPLARVRLGQRQAWFIARHGRPHRIPPHRINYRANIDALRRQNVQAVVAINAVGAIDRALEDGTLVVPDQLIDYTWGRVHSFSDDDLSPLQHVEFANPYSDSVRAKLIEAGGKLSLEMVEQGVMAVTQGPRLETAAEIERLRRDGCTVVGMTSMPETVLAREAGIAYACLGVVVNPAASVDDPPISIDEIARTLDRSMETVASLLAALN